MPKELLDLQQRSVDGARVYATRTDALDFWPRGAVVAEVGVALGDFTQLILSRTSPALFDAYDIFAMHKQRSIWGRTPAEVFQGKTHQQFYEDRFAGEITTKSLRIFHGDGATEIAKQPAHTYDVIYIDADHLEPAVQRDVEASIPVLKPDGLLVFNDYVMFDRNALKYGTIPVVNDLCCNYGWKVAYVALQREGYLDVAIKKI